MSKQAEQRRRRWRKKEEKLSIEEKLFFPRLFGFAVSTESQHSVERHVVRGVQ